MDTEHLPTWDLSSLYASINDNKIKEDIALLQGGVRVFITDTLGDIKEAKKVNVHTIAITWGFHASIKLQEGKPDAIVKEPSRILDRIEDILREA